MKDIKGLSGGKSNQTIHYPHFVQNKPPGCRFQLRSSVGIIVTQIFDKGGADTELWQHTLSIP